MAGTGNIVSHHLRGILAQEESSGVLDTVDPIPGVVHQKAQVLGRDAVHQVHRVVQGVGHDDSPLPLQCLPGYFAPGRASKPQFHLLFYPADQVFAVGYQNGGGQRVVLGLGDQVGRTEAGVGRIVGENNGLCGTEHAVNVHLPLNQFLGVGDEDVAGPADFVHLGHGLGTVGHCGDRRNSADLVEGVDTGDFGGGYYCWVQWIVAQSGGGQYHFAHSRDPGGNGGH